MSVAVPAENQRLVMGRLGAVHGVRGWIKLVSYAEEPADLLTYQPWWVQRAGQWETFTVDAHRPHGAAWIVHRVGLDDRDVARAYTGLQVWVAKSQLPDLAGDTYYWHQLIGLQVYDAAGTCFGVVQQLLETGANDVLVVRDTQAHEYLIPYVESVVQHVDLAAGQIRVDWDRDF